MLLTKLRFRSRRPVAFRNGSSCRIESLESRQLLAGLPLNTFTQVNLVSDGTVPAAFTDANLVNAWGLSSSPTGPMWVSSNGQGLATVYNGHGEAQNLVVTIPAPASAGAGATSAPTGQVFNGTTGFQITANGQTAASTFIFATEDGTIAGWNPTVSADTAVIAVDNSDTSAVYKGIATASSNGQQFIYAADFHNRKIAVFDTNFNPVTLAGTFKDPVLNANFAPFNIALINGQLYVSYAKQDAAKHDDASALGRGFIDVFNTDGTFVKRLVTRGQLDSPWGMAIAPAGFGRFGGDLLVGNFGNGNINVYNPTTGVLQGRLKDLNGMNVRIDGLWGLRFGNGGSAGSTNSLFFTAGPNGESHALFGLLGFSGTGQVSSSPPGGVSPGATTVLPSEVLAMDDAKLIG